MVLKTVLAWIKDSGTLNSYGMGRLNTLTVLNRRFPTEAANPHGPISFKYYFSISQNQSQPVPNPNYIICPDTSYSTLSDLGHVLRMLLAISEHNPTKLRQHKEDFAYLTKRILQHIQVEPLHF